MVTTEPTPISPKVTAATGAVLVATAVAGVASLFGVEVEVTEEGLAGIGAVLTLAVFVSGYLRRDPLRRSRR